MICGLDRGAHNSILVFSTVVGSLMFGGTQVMAVGIAIAWPLREWSHEL